MTYLPNDILYMVCTQLWHQRDYGTLLNCACSGKQLANMAITNLYRTQGVAPIDRDFLPHNSFKEKILSDKRMLMKCAGLWRTIILSSLGKTLYPYSQYIRTLNLKDLEELLKACQYQPSRISRVFFHGELTRLKLEYPGPKIKNESGKVVEDLPQLDVEETMSEICEAVTKQTPLVEELEGKVPKGNLSRWIPRLPRLKSWISANGGAIMRGNGTPIRLHCPQFKRLKIRDWISNEGVAAFVNELRPQSLESFETCTGQILRPEVFHALNCHAESLIELRHKKLAPESIPKVSLLKYCTNLVSLSLSGYDDELYTYDLEKSDYDVFLETVAWLKECKKLQTLAFADFYNAPAFMATLFLESSIQLTSLKYEGFIMRDTKKFHQALANQTSLQTLWLIGVMDEEELESGTNSEQKRLWLKGYKDEDALDADVLVESLSKLVNLTELRLLWISNCFNDRHIIQLARSLPKLEVWWTSGNWLTDDIWSEFTSLRSLRKLDLPALANFTADGVLDFIEQVGPGNEGLVLSLSNTEKFLWVEEQLIHETISQKANGKFNFTLTTDSGRWAYGSDSDSESDSYLGDFNPIDGISDFSDRESE